MPEIFVGIGAQKAGTSWVRKYLRAHPSVAVSPIDELHYFDAKYMPEQFAVRDRNVRRTLLKLLEDCGPAPTREKAEIIRCYALRFEMIADERRYLDYFTLLSDEHRIAGEITPAYSALDAEGFAHIKRLTNTSKILLVLRDPVDRVWSHMRYRERKGVSAYQALDGALNRPQVVLRTEYDRTLRELYRVFAKEEVCVLFYENLFSHATHEKELRRLTNFLEIDYLSGDIRDRVNETQTIGSLSPDWERAIFQRFRGVYESIIALFSTEVPQSWKDRLARLSI